MTAALSPGERPPPIAFDRRDRKQLVARISGGTGGVILLVNLRTLRGDRSLKDAAAAIGIRPDELSRIEQGKTSQIRWETILRCAVAYGCGLDDILTIERVVAFDNDLVRTAGARAAMLAAMRSGAGQPVPRRRMHLDGKRELSPPSATALDAVGERTDRGPVRRRFSPARSR